MRTLTLVLTDCLYVSELYYRRLKSCKTEFKIISVPLKLEILKKDWIKLKILG